MISKKKDVIEALSKGADDAEHQAFIMSGRSAAFREVVKFLDDYDIIEIEKEPVVSEKKK